MKQKKEMVMIFRKENMRMLQRNQPVTEIHLFQHNPLSEGTAFISFLGPAFSSSTVAISKIRVGVVTLSLAAI